MKPRDGNESMFRRREGPREERPLCDLGSEIFTKINGRAVREVCIKATTRDEKGKVRRTGSGVTPENRGKSPYMTRASLKSRRALFARRNLTGSLSSLLHAANPTRRVLSLPLI